MLFSFNKLSEKKSIGLFFLIVLAVIGMVLLVLGGNSGKQSPTETVSEKDNVETYKKELEEEIRSLCKSVKGVKNVTVTVTLESGFTSVYATEAGREGDNYVILGNGSNAKALLISQETPEIRGIGIVCCGGGNDTIRQELIALLSATYHVSTNRIYVTEAD